ncbi:filamentous hemagglutinin [Pseudomonas aeruginosa PA38182]|nr:filamentous hemagglutinin [Pseudomonas aeruginosa PA38182]
MSSQLIGVLAASTQGDADAKSLQTGAWVAGNATQHNYLSHWHEEKKRQEVSKVLHFIGQYPVGKFFSTPANLLFAEASPNSFFSRK